MTPFDRWLLAQTLTFIDSIDPSANGAEGAPDAEGRYEQRNRLIWQALAIAIRGGWDAGVALDGNEPERVVVYIELPTGQVSWHVPLWQGDWDGHSIATKAKRIRTFASAPDEVTFADRRAVADPSVDHSSHSMQWVGGCGECPSDGGDAAVIDLKAERS